MTARRTALAAQHALSLWAHANPVIAPSGTVLGALISFGDIRDWRDDGTTLIRFSPERVEREDMRLLLGDERRRALEVSIVWDEFEEQIVQVLDTLPLRKPALGPTGNAYADARMRGYPRYDLAAPERRDVAAA